MHILGRFGCLVAAAIWLVVLPVGGAAAGDPAIAAVIEKELNASTDAEAIALRESYFAELKQFAILHISQALSIVKVPAEEIDKELDAVSLERVDGKHCLSQTTLLDIFDALRAGCLPPRDMKSIILPKYSRGDKEIYNTFFPYSLARLRDSRSSLAYAFHYNEDPKGEKRNTTEILIVLAFLNLYWDRVKDKPTLSPIEYAIAFSAVRNYALKLKQQVCGRSSGQEKSNCERVHAEIQKISNAAGGKPVAP
jgi:hypothetical protein